MHWFPPLQLGWLNGWVLLVGFYAVFGLLMLIFPSEVVARLYDRSGWGQSQRVNATLAKLVAFVSFVLIFLTPLKPGTSFFWVGLVLYLLGFALMVVALINYANTPMDEPVVDGVYAYSRNPQWVALVLVMLGIALAIGSGIVLLLVGVIIVLGHRRILAEEQACLEQYDKAYRDYIAEIPRYFLVL